MYTTPGAALFLEESLADCFVKVRVLELENGVLPKVELYTEPNQNSKVSSFQLFIYNIPVFLLHSANATRE